MNITLLDVYDSLHFNAVLALLLEASRGFLYRYTEDGRTERLRPVVIHVHHCTNHNPILQCRLLSVFEVL